MNNVVKEAIINFIMGGLLIAICGYIAEKYSSSLSGMIYSSIPMGLLYLYIYIYLKQNKNETKKYAFFSIIGGILWVLIAVVLYYLVELPLILTVTFTIIFYLIFSVILFKFFNNKINANSLKKMY